MTKPYLFKSLVIFYAFYFAGWLDVPLIKFGLCLLGAAAMATWFDLTKEVE